MQPVGAVQVEGLGHVRPHVVRPAVPGDAQHRGEPVQREGPGSCSRRSGCGRAGQRHPGHGAGVGDQRARVLGGKSSGPGGRRRGPHRSSRPAPGRGRRVAASAGGTLRSVKINGARHPSGPAGAGRRPMRPRRTPSGRSASPSNTHGAAIISHSPSWRTPPHGPYTIRLGQPGHALLGELHAAQPVTLRRGVGCRAATDHGADPQRVALTGRARKAAYSQTCLLEDERIAASCGPPRTRCACRCCRC